LFTFEKIGIMGVLAENMMVKKHRDSTVQRLCCIL